MSATQAMASAGALLLAAVSCSPVMPTAADGIASAVCVAAQAYRFGDTAGTWDVEARIDKACLAGPPPPWAMQVGVLGIRAGIQHDVGGFSVSVDAAAFLHPLSSPRRATRRQAEA